MTENRLVDPEGVHPTVGYSHVAVVPGGTELVFIAGQVPADLDGSVPEDFVDQARLAWRNVEFCLASAGCGFDDLVKVTMYIRDRKFRAASRDVRQEVLGDRRPVLTAIITDHIDERFLLEIEAIASRNLA